MRDNGIYYADGRLGNFNRGKHSLGTKLRTEAMANLFELDRVKAFELGLIDRPIANDEDQKIGLGEGLDVFFEKKNVDPLLGGISPASLTRYRTITKKFLRFAAENGLKFWNNVTRDHLEIFSTWLRYKRHNKKQSYASNTIVAHLTIVKSVNKLLIREKRLSEDCKIELRIPKIETSSTYCYSKQEVMAMLRFCEESEDLGWMHDLIQFLAMTGARISEALAVRFSDIDWEVGFVTFKDERFKTQNRSSKKARTTKGKRTRSVPVHASLMETLKKISASKQGKVFQHPKNVELSYQIVLDSLKKELLEGVKEQFPSADGEIGFQNGRLHSFRHFFVSECFRQGVPEDRIRDWVGHQDSRMLNRYRHLRPEDGLLHMAKLNFLD